MHGRFRHHRYTWSKPFGSVRHSWRLCCIDGGIEFNTSLHDSFPASCGLEIHRIAPADYQRGEAPHHFNCEVTGGRCWHDGTSLYASEQLWPLIEPYVRRGDHETIFRILEGEATARFEYGADEDDAEPDTPQQGAPNAR